MKTKTTKKTIKNNYKNIIEIGYCNLWHLLSNNKPIFYTSGVYGWNANIHQVNDNTVIVTGYRPFGNISVNYSIQKEYEEKAKKIYNNHDLKYEEIKEKINILLQDFIKEVLKNG